MLNYCIVYNFYDLLLWVMFFQKYMGWFPIGIAYEWSTTSSLSFKNREIKHEVILKNLIIRAGKGVFQISINYWFTLFHFVLLFFFVVYYWSWCFLIFLFFRFVFLSCCWISNNELKTAFDFNDFRQVCLAFLRSRVLQVQELLTVDLR